MAWIKPRAQKLTEHFNTVELVCRHCGKAPSMEALQKLAVFLERVREGLGGYPLHVNSGVRCVAHNKAIGGATDSFHVQARAADIVARGLTPAGLYAGCKALQKEGIVGGLGKYASGFCHVDNGPKRSWTG